MNYTKKHNNEMGGVGIADNIRNYYRIYIWVRNRKWWWYILFWDVGVIPTNEYIIYICIHNMHVTPRKDRLSRNNFIQAILCVWIKPEKYSAESFQLQMGFSFPFLRSNDLRSSLLNIRARSFLLSCTKGLHTQG